MKIFIFIYFNKETLCVNGHFLFFRMTSNLQKEHEKLNNN
jgi:hypothetical protein